MFRFMKALSAVALAALAFTVGSRSLEAQNVLQAQFTPTPIVVDGTAEAAWSSAVPQNISICMNPALTSQLSNCATSGTVKAMWNGPLLYLLINVVDPSISITSTTTTNQSSVQIYFDQYNDKFPKFQEDMGTITVNAAGVQTGNGTNAGLLYYPTVWQTHLQKTAAAYTYDSNQNKTGYTVEVGWYIGDRPLVNNTVLGMEFASLLLPRPPIQTSTSCTGTAVRIRGRTARCHGAM